MRLGWLVMLVDRLADVAEGNSYNDFREMTKRCAAGDERAVLVIPTSEEWQVACETLTVLRQVG